MDIYFLQITAAVAEQAQPAADDSISYLELLYKGGVIMIPILALSVVATYLFIERYLYIKKASREDARIINYVTNCLRKGDVTSAIDYCEQSKSPFANMAKKALFRVGSPISDIESALQHTASVELAHMEKNLTILSAISAIAPMLGFLGTVFGMITTFHDIAVASDISMGVIADGIYKKMITSATGLIVGICAYCYYTYLNNMIDRVAVSLEMNSIDFLDPFFKPVQ